MTNLKVHAIATKDGSIRALDQWSGDPADFIYPSYEVLDMFSDSMGLSSNTPLVLADPMYPAAFDAETYQTLLMEIAGFDVTEPHDTWDLTQLAGDLSLHVAEFPETQETLGALLDFITVCIENRLWWYADHRPIPAALYS